MITNKQILVRNSYLSELIPYLDNKLVKVLVGQRRAGKSYILQQLIQYLIIQKKVAQKNILYLNFELHENQEIQTQKDLTNFIDNYLKTVSNQDTAYLFLDEIQEVHEWERAITSYQARTTHQLQIFITGSNSKLLSSELATYLTGRYISKTIHPFSLEEFEKFHQLPHNKETLLTYLKTTGIPEAYNLPNDELRTSFFGSLKESILMKDIVRRYEIRNPQLLNTLFHFLIDNIGGLFSANKMVNTLNTHNIKTNVNSINSYLDYLENAYLIKSIQRYDLKGKKILEGEKKYYLNDLAFQNYFTSSFDIRNSKLLENFVLNHLLIKGYKVYIGKLNDIEIDFVAEKNKKKFYLQVAYILDTEKVIQREYGNLEKIHDHWPKYVVSLDDLTLPPKNGIHHIQAWNISEHLS
ncbi:MAG: ATP-binding protein [Candidatus Margulisbacteria bacterium]|nr:ATP-binding protein [Candidatus Margulisiibacteriota bacterium]